MARHLGLFDLTLASSDGRNLKGVEKRDAIVQQVSKPFSYAGDSSADMPIWKEAHSAVLVGASVATRRALVQQQTPIEHEFPKESVTIADWLRALRVHQWIKNILMFVPLLTSFALLDQPKLWATFLAFVAFSLTASATYIVNDLWDLDSDRAHPRKHARPFASGRLDIVSGLAVAALCLLCGVLLALAVSNRFLAVLGIYLVLTSAYSWALKEYVLLDVLLLAALYALRILAGSAAGNIQVSSWLLAFSIFLFLSLAMVKRCAELVTVQQSGRTSVRGRDYKSSDLVVLWPIGTGAGLCAVVVFGLFINSPDTAVRYASPELLWLVALVLMYWLGRLWIKTARGEMHDDPIVFAITNRGSLQAVAAMVACVLLARWWVSLEGVVLL